jgi:hypothetical protein
MIYELDAKIDAILSATHGDMTDEVEALLLDRDQKMAWLNNATKKLLNERSLVAGLKAERDRVVELIKDREATIERLEATIGRLVGEGQKADLGFAKVSWRKSEAVMIADGAVEKLDDRFIVTSFAVDKKAVKEALKAGEELVGCELVERNNMSIK